MMLIVEENKEFTEFSEEFSALPYLHIMNVSST